VCADLFILTFKNIKMDIKNLGLKAWHFVAAVAFVGLGVAVGNVMYDGYNTLKNRAKITDPTKKAYPAKKA